MGIRGERGRGDWTCGGCRMGRGSIIILFLTKVYPCSSRTLRLIYLYVGTGKGVFTKLLLKPVLCLSKALVQYTSIRSWAGIIIQ